MTNFIELELITQEEYSDINERLKNISSIAYFNWDNDKYHTVISFYAYITYPKNSDLIKYLDPNNKWDVRCEAGRDGGTCGSIRKLK